MTDQALRVSGLSHSYKQHRVLRDVSFFVKRGEIVGLLGPNGAGKTTAFTLVVGLLAVQLGRIRLDGKNIAAWNIVRRAQVGLIYMPQESSVFTRLTVAENILSVLEFYPKLYQNREAILAKVTRQLSIDHLLNRTAGVLSGGERRRLEIARALALSPKYLLLDEPFSGIDPIAISEIRKIIVELTHLDIGILITDHNVRDTLGVCDRAYLLNQGTIVESGTPAQFSESQIARQFYLGKEFRL